MKLSRRSIIKAGIGFSASFFARPVDVFAQAQPLLQKKIPSSGESMPIIGIGTAVGLAMAVMASFLSPVLRPA